MPSDAAPTAKEALAWRAIQDNIVLAQSFVAGMTIEQFCVDQRTFYAVTRCLEIISEAARRLRGPQQAHHPHLAWRQIEDSGNVFRHSYQVVAETLIWATVQARLPELLAASRNALTDAPPRGHKAE